MFVTYHTCISRALHCITRDKTYSAVGAYRRKTRACLQFGVVITQLFADRCVIYTIPYWHCAERRLAVYVDVAHNTAAVCTPDDIPNS